MHQKTTIVIVNEWTAVLRKSVRIREVNNQAWIIDETRIYAKIAFFLLSPSLSLCASVFFLCSLSLSLSPHFSTAQTLRQWRAAHVLRISLPFSFASFFNTICSPHAIKICSTASLQWSKTEKRARRERKKSVLFWLSSYSNSRRA